MLLAHTPRVCWLKPMVQNDITFVFGSAYSSASCSSHPRSAPVISTAFSSVYGATKAANSS